MKTRLFLVIGLMAGLVSSGSARDRGGTVGIWGGYTSVGMSDVNDNLDRVQDTIGAQGTVTNIKNGYSMAIEGLLYVAPGLQIGPRVEYIVPNEGKVAVDALLVNADVSQKLYLVPLMFGLRYMLKDFPSEPGNGIGRYAFSIGAFGGWGLAYGTTKLTSSSVLAPGTEVNSTLDYNGSSFVGDVLLGFQVLLSRTVALGIDAGYRFANIPEMNTSGSGGGSLFAPGKAVVVNTSGNKMKFDFSGIFANIGLNFLF
jgi:hypothetical protein